MATGNNLDKDIKRQRELEKSGGEPLSAVKGHSLKKDRMEGLHACCARAAHIMNLRPHDMP